MVEATRDSLYITEANTPMIFFRYLPSEIDDLPNIPLPADLHAKVLISRKVASNETSQGAVLKNAL